MKKSRLVKAPSITRVAQSQGVGCRGVSLTTSEPPKPDEGSCSIYSDELRKEADEPSSSLHTATAEEAWAAEDPHDYSFYGSYSVRSVGDPERPINEMRCSTCPISKNEKLAVSESEMWLCRKSVIVDDGGNMFSQYTQCAANKPFGHWRYRWHQQFCKVSDISTFSRNVPSLKLYAIGILADNASHIHRGLLVTLPSDLLTAVWNAIVKKRTDSFAIWEEFIANVEGDNYYSKLYDWDRYLRIHATELVSLCKYMAFTTPWLVHLDLRNSSLDSDSYKCIADITCLQRLGIGSSDVADDVIRFWIRAARADKLQRLEYLEMRKMNMSQSTTTGLHTFPRLKYVITELDLPWPWYRRTDQESKALSNVLSEAGSKAELTTAKLPTVHIHIAVKRSLPIARLNTPFPSRDSDLWQRNEADVLKRPTGLSEQPNSASQRSAKRIRTAVTMENPELLFRQICTNAVARTDAKAQTDVVPLP